jgi:RNA polymerase sigma-70 factor, ECF subfamily
MTTPTTPLADTLAAHRPYLIRFASRRLRDAALVEDVVQETLLAALQGVAGFEAKASLRTWLTAILARRIADAVRHQARRPLGTCRDDAADDDGPDADDGLDGDTTIDWIDPQRRLEGRQFLDTLDACLARLPPAAARLFTLREIDGLSHEEASGALGLSARDSSLLLHRARISLRAGLAVHAPARA